MHNLRLWSTPGLILGEEVLSPDLGELILRMLPLGQAEEGRVTAVVGPINIQKLERKKEFTLP